MGELMTEFDKRALASPTCTPYDDDLERLSGVFDEQVKAAEAAGIVFDAIELNLAFNEATDRLADRGEDSIEQVVESVLENYGREVENAKI